MNEKEKFKALIASNPSIKRYQAIEKLINENKTLKQKMNQLKAVQKQLVNAKHIDKKEAVATYEQTYQQLYEEIQNFPLMSEYLDLQEEINDMLQAVADIIEQGFEN